MWQRPVATGSRRGGGLWAGLGYAGETARQLGKGKGTTRVVEDRKDAEKCAFPMAFMLTAVSLTDNRSYYRPYPLDMKPEVKQLAPGHNTRK